MYFSARDIAALDQFETQARKLAETIGWIEKQRASNPSLVMFALKQLEPSVDSYAKAVAAISYSLCSIPDDALDELTENWPRLSKALHSEWEGK